MRRIRVALVTNVPAPYRLPALQRLARCDDIELHAIYCAPAHIDATLDAGAHDFATHWLRARYRAHERRFMHSDPGVWRVLAALRPDVVITTGYIPTFLYAFGWSCIAGVPHVVLTDGTLASEQGLTPLHRWVRRRVWRRSAAFAGACEGSLDLFRAASIDESHLFKVPLAVDNARFGHASVPSSEGVDFLFCGRLLPHKRPAFALDVAAATAQRIGRRTTLDFVGIGPEEAALRVQAARAQHHVVTRFLGHHAQQALPERYAAARLFLFPSEWDPWGVVANEACASGVPVLVSPHAGAAHELVIDGRNGHVLPLQREAWADAAAALLRDGAQRERMGAWGREIVRGFSFDVAASGLAQAIRCADSRYPGRGLLERN